VDVDGTASSRTAGLLDATGRLTDRGRSVRASIEDQTDRSGVGAAWAALTDADLVRLDATLSKLGRAITDDEVRR
jgi:hypothetical protein